jgi:predicted ribosome quality control (RQC) complex YloA/Tae2 family protein
LQAVKSSLSSFDIAALIPELNETLKGAFLDKIYQPERDELLLVFSTKSGKRDLLLKAGKFLFMGRKGENPQEPSSMVMFLRKNMGNARVSGIRQHGFDRIVEIELEKAEKYTIIAEFFRNGNISVVKDGIILIPLFFQRWSTRALIPKEEYKYPPESADPRELERDEISERLKDSNKDLVRTNY